MGKSCSNPGFLTGGRRLKSPVAFPSLLGPLFALLWAPAGVGVVNKGLSTPVVLQPMPGCVCHRAVHGDWADGSHSDDGGHRWGRPCVPGTGSGRVTGKESLQQSQLWALSACWQQVGRVREVVGRKGTH